MSAETTLLNNKVILITGAAGGIGSEVAKSYAHHGATVILLDKNLPALESLYDTIVADNSAEPALYPLDMKGATASDYINMAAKIEQSFGRLDGIVHCAATLGQLSPTIHQDSRLWLETLQVNLTAPFLLTKSCLPLLQNCAREKPGMIIFTTDSNQNKAYWGAYGTSKAGIENLCQQLAREFEAAGNIKVFCLDPGQTRTALFSRAYPARNPDDLPAPSAVAPAYLYLATANSHHLHGQCVSALSIL
ncbi:oxidoreductase, short-chain dehydrogenase/reductase family [Methylophaga frappieri]|uniref:Oxidoreductase, short-chain dehydrogenase/reductase family n=2 Tax=Methylophaga frappieri (strain ATCC BAA-2434 / DSM 25690 / JAM7) TaxID=754477 RepID=I1YK57_METFJ|nr:oxidoreductase, short-chain dehydrogenase/reductase family [Methylophaga frappieri]